MQGALGLTDFLLPRMRERQTSSSWMTTPSGNINDRKSIKINISTIPWTATQNFLRDTIRQANSLAEHNSRFASQMWNYILQRCDQAKAVATSSFEDLYGQMGKAKVNSNNAGSLTAFQLLVELAEEKSKGKEWNAFAGELERLAKILGDSPWLPKSAKSLKLLFSQWFLAYFVEPVTLSYCEQGIIQEARYSL
jgi:hypothetical protein